MTHKFKIGLFTALASLILSGCGANANKASKFRFENKITYIESGDKVNVLSTLGKTVTYSFQGGTPEGVTLDSTKGIITYNPDGNTIPERVYIASANGLNDVYTIIHFNLHLETPTIKYNNVSSYIVNGDAISASATTTSGRNYAVSYELKEDVPGIALDETSGKVKFSNHVADQTRFTVVAKAHDATLEKEFIAMTTGVITAAKDTCIVKYGSDESATFVLDFGDNVEGDNETTSENIGIAYDGVIMKTPAGLTYNQTTKEVTFGPELIRVFAKGENKVSILTQRNAVVVSLIACDNFITSAKELADSFEADYSYSKPRFKEGSLSAYYVLANDIDLTDYLSKEGEGYNNGRGWKPIGCYEDQVYDIPFTGTFNGNGHTIRGFSYNGRPTAVNGLFGRSTGTIKNLRLEGKIFELPSWSAALCGNNGGTIENIICDVDFRNPGSYATGVICSVNHGIISNCLTINENVNGYTITQQPWQKAGIAVGLNETDGTISKTFGVGDATKYGLFGCSQNTELTLEKAGALFASQAEMAAFDFSGILNPEAFEFVPGQLPTLKVGA